jgi:peptidoglycan/xylan/chitin deacetylase (PgdA/CDA1 family)
MMLNLVYSKILPWLYPTLIWRMPDKDKTVYLTFDDGPHPKATSFVLEQLVAYQAKATFFCVGKNILLYPHLVDRLVQEGHRLGNHTFHHLNGWQAPENDYLHSVELNRQLTHHTDLFRPPYGKLTASLIRKLQSRFRIVMWNILSGDYDRNNTPQQCIRNVLNHITPGSIVVFHDSEKAFFNLHHSLPVILRCLTEQGYQMKTIH